MNKILLLIGVLLSQTTLAADCQSVQQEYVQLNRAYHAAGQAYQKSVDKVIGMEKSSPEAEAEMTISNQLFNAWGQSMAALTSFEQSHHDDFKACGIRSTRRPL